MILLLIKLDFNLDRTKFEYLYEFTEKSTKERISKFVLYNDSLRTLFGELLVKKYFCERLGYRFESIRFIKNRYGKPYIMEGKHFFNISHSGSYIVCAIDNNEVGVDIEKIDEIDLMIAKRFFSEEEYGLLSTECNNKLSLFYKLWTMKESYIKAIGKGLNKNLSVFSVMSDIHCNQVLEDGKYLEWYIYNFDLLKDYKISVCSPKEKIKYIVDYVTVDEVLSFYSKI